MNERLNELRHEILNLKNYDFVISCDVEFFEDEGWCFEWPNSIKDGDESFYLRAKNEDTDEFSEVLVDESYMNETEESLIRGGDTPSLNAIALRVMDDFFEDFCY